MKGSFFALIALSFSTSGFAANGTLTNSYGMGYCPTIIILDHQGVQCSPDATTTTNDNPSGDISFTIFDNVKRDNVAILFHYNSSSPDTSHHNGYNLTINSLNLKAQSTGVQLTVPVHGLCNTYILSDNNHVAKYDCSVTDVDNRQIEIVYIGQLIPAPGDSKQSVQPNSEIATPNTPEDNFKAASACAMGMVSKFFSMGANTVSKHCQRLYQMYCGRDVSADGCIVNLAMHIHDDD